MKIKIIQPIKIESYEVVDLDVYNIELESDKKEDDLFYYDLESGLLNHNCLRKDFGMINENFSQTDLILQAYKINEFMPKYYVDLLMNFLKKECQETNNDWTTDISDIQEATVGILGYTFKKDTDDCRDSSVPKLLRYINKQNPKNVLINEPNLLYGGYIDIFNNNFKFENIAIEQVIKQSDIIIIAMDHSCYNNIDKSLFKGKIVLDCWNILDSGLISIV